MSDDDKKPAMGDFKLHRAVVPFIEWLGFGLGVDLDRSLIIVQPEEVWVATIVHYLRSCEKQVVYELERRAQSARHQFVGGPLNGQRHDGYYYGRRCVVRHLARASWAAYRVEKDGRAFYCGTTTSKQKAKALVWSTVKPDISP